MGQPPDILSSKESSSCLQPNHLSLGLPEAPLEFFQDVLFKHSHVVWGLFVYAHCSLPNRIRKAQVSFHLPLEEDEADPRPTPRMVGW